MELKEIIEAGLKSQELKLDAAIAKFEGQLTEKGKVDSEVKTEVKELAEGYNALAAQLKELSQKQAPGHQGQEKLLAAGDEFVQSESFKALARNETNRARVEVKNTILGSPTTTTNPQYQPGVVPGAFRPLTIRDILPQYQTSTDLVVLTREASFTNAAAEVSQGLAKPESAMTFDKYNVPIETVAHWVKVSKQLLADAPAVASYINTRLRFGVEARIDSQLLNGDGTNPNLSGLMDTGNYTVYSPTSDDDLVSAINRAKYTLWNTGYVADAVIVNPADWGAQEIAKGTDGHFLYGFPGQFAGMNPFGIPVVISSAMTAGQFLIGQFQASTGVWNREGTVVEAGFVNDDFTKNLVTLRAEARLGLEVSVPAALLGGAFTA